MYQLSTACQSMVTGGYSGWDIWMGASEIIWGAVLTGGTGYKLWTMEADPAIADVAGGVILMAWGGAFIVDGLVRTYRTIQASDN